MEADEARELVAEWQGSGQPLRTWCARRGIDGRSLRYWADRSPKEPILRLVELTTPRRSASASALRVGIADVTIAVGDEFSDEALIRVIRAVRAC